MTSNTGQSWAYPRFWSLAEKEVFVRLATVNFDGVQPELIEMVADGG